MNSSTNSGSNSGSNSDSNSDSNSRRDWASTGKLGSVLGSVWKTRAGER